MSDPFLENAKSQKSDASDAIKENYEAYEQCIKEAYALITKGE